MILKFDDDGTVSVEEEKDGIKYFKVIDPDSLVNCISESMKRGTVTSGLLPRNCLSFTAHDSGEKDICLLFPGNKADVSYMTTEYKDFPLPRLVFGFQITKEGRIGSSRLGIVADDKILKPETKMFYYPFSNVSGFHLCTGNNTLPKCKSLHTIASLPYYILSMPNNNDHFNANNNQNNLEMRDLFELLKDKPPEFYYSNILIPNNLTLNDFMNRRRF